MDKKSGPQRRAGRNTGTHRGGSSEGTKRKHVAAEAAAVTEHARQRMRRPLHKAGGAESGRYRKKAAAMTAAVIGSGRPL
jgi:hypothetical protein